MLYRASMGPRPFSRGNPDYAGQTPQLKCSLQWGRDLSVAETGQYIPWYRQVHGFNGAATFQSRKHPQRPHGRAVVLGFNGAATFQSRKPRRRGAPRVADVAASMGPRPFSRGNPTSYAGSASVSRLQWGRDLSVAETCLTRFAFLGSGSLQWGRDLSVAETRQTTKKNAEIIEASMGPRPFSRGNDASQGTHTRRTVASMGPRPFSRGNLRTEADQMERQPASMGPRPFSRGNYHTLEAFFEVLTMSFNGAATFQSRKQPTRRDNRQRVPVCCAFDTGFGWSQQVPGWLPRFPALSTGCFAYESASASYLIASRPDSSRADCDDQSPRSRRVDCTTLRRPSLRGLPAPAAAPASLASPTLDLRPVPCRLSAPCLL